MRPIGWRRESYRHYLAAKGVSTVKRRYQRKFPDLVKDFPGENPRITERFARFRQEDPKKFEFLRTKRVSDDTVVIVGRPKRRKVTQVQSVLIDRKKHFASKWKSVVPAAAEVPHEVSPVLGQKVMLDRLKSEYDPVMFTENLQEMYPTVTPGETEKLYALAAKSEDEDLKTKRENLKELMRRRDDMKQRMLADLESAERYHQRLLEIDPDDVRGRASGVTIAMREEYLEKSRKTVADAIRKLDEAVHISELELGLPPDKSKDIRRFTGGAF